MFCQRDTSCRPTCRASFNSSFSESGISDQRVVLDEEGSGTIVRFHSRIWGWLNFKSTLWSTMTRRSSSHFLMQAHDRLKVHTFNGHDLFQEPTLQHDTQSGTHLLEIRTSLYRVVEKGVRGSSCGYSTSKCRENIPPLWVSERIDQIYLRSTKTVCLFSVAFAMGYG